MKRTLVENGNDESDRIGLLMPRYRIVMRKDAPLTPHVVERIYETLEDMRYRWATMSHDEDISETTRRWFDYLSSAIGDAPLTVTKPEWQWAPLPVAPQK